MIKYFLLLTSYFLLNKVFDYLQKFNQLPKNLRDKVSTPEVMAAINELEKKYGTNLASTVMKVMIREIALVDLTKYFIEEDGLDVKRGEELSKEIKEKVFGGVKDYLEVPEESKKGEEKKEIGKPEKREKELFSPVRGASFFFSPEDEEEIRELAKKIDGELGAGLSDEQIEDKLNKIIAAAQINFGSQQLADRFRSILKTYLRGIRDRIETKQTLKKTFAEGGLGFDNDSVDEVLKITDDVARGEKVSLKPPVKIKLPEDEIASQGSGDKIASLKNIGVRDVDYDFSAVASRKEERKDVPSSPVNLPLPKEEGVKDAGKLDIKHELAPPPAIVIKKPLAAEPVKAAELSRPESGIPSQDFTLPSQEFGFKKLGGTKAPLRPLVQTAGKKKMEDVKYIPPKIMNPIDELRYMDLVNFRRPSLEPQKQTAKVKEKISLLEEENYGKRTEGIRGWRQSPVNRLYLSIGQQSIGEGKPIDVIIEERKNAGEDYLTMEEFKAVMDLNKELRF